MPRNKTCRPPIDLYLDMVSTAKGRTFDSVVGWAGLVAALEQAPDDVYEIVDSDGERVGNATADGKGRWHIWGGSQRE